MGKGPEGLWAGCHAEALPCPGPPGHFAGSRVSASDLFASEAAGAPSVDLVPVSLKTKGTMATENGRRD